MLRCNFMCFDVWAVYESFPAYGFMAKTSLTKVHSCGNSYQKKFQNYNNVLLFLSAGSRNDFFKTYYINKYITFKHDKTCIGAPMQEIINT